MAISCFIFNGGGYGRPHVSSFCTRCKVALYSFFGARGIGTNGVSARACNLKTSLKTRVFGWSKNAYWVRSRRWIFLTMSKWIGFFFLSLLEKIIRFYTYINVLRVKNENQNLSTDFLVALSAETSWMFTPFPLKKKKIHHVETWKHHLEVREVKKTSQASLSIVAIATTFGFWKSLPYVI